MLERSWIGGIGVEVGKDGMGFWSLGNDSWKGVGVGLLVGV
ncbi:hypothetical protein [Staphylococcus capitis]